MAQVLKSEGVSYVMIEQDEAIIAQLEGSGQLTILGDATQDDILDLAGISRASGIVCALSEDAYNVFITLSARDKILISKL